ncbi:MAG: A24 family peptidase [Vicinamibacterales bacterium]
MTALVLATTSSLAPAGVPAWLVAGLAGLLGLVVGSFLNVCIYRLPRGQSIVWPGSRCGACGRTLRWYENVPVLSWLVLRGRCRTCRAAISATYPAVEAATGVLFLGGYLVHGLHPLLPVRLTFASLLVVLFVIDLRHRILPDRITLSGIAIGLGASVALPPGPASAFAGAALGGGLLWAISEGYFRLRGREGLGFGDVKMLAMIGAFLGWELTLLTLFVASLAGSVAGLALIATRRGDLQSALPFGTFLTIGALVAAGVGDRLVAWYAGLYA